MSQFFDQASLVMVPSGYKNGKVYSQKPLSTDGELTFTRSNDTATRVNSSGLIEKVRTNLLTYSNDFSNAVWSKVRVALTGGQSDPFGGTNAWKMECASSTGSVQIVQNATIGNGSIYAKAGNVSSFNIWVGLNVTFDLSTGTITSGASNGKIESVGNGWYRCTAINSIATVHNPNFTGSSLGDYVYIAFAQGETGDIATDYIATTSAAVSVGPVANLPRLDYSGGATCPSLKLEPQRSNLCLWSEAFDNAAWTKDFNGAGSAPVITANYTTSPDGYQNADRIQFSSSTATSSDYSIVSQPIALGSTGTFSLYVKSLTSSTQNLLVYWGGGQGDVFEVTTEWTRITLAGLAVQTTYVIFGTRGESGNYYNGGDATLDIAVWGAQLEEGAYATSYIPTLSAAVTRGADMSGTTDYFGAQTFAGDFAFFVDLLPMEGNTAISDAMILGGGDYNGGGNFQSYFRFASGNIVLKGVAEALVIVRSYTMTANQQYKILVTRTGTTVKIFANGAQVGASATSSVSVILRSLGWSYIQASYNYDGRINQVLLMPSGLTDAQAIELTTI
jgi:hypothetical protein